MVKWSVLVVVLLLVACGSEGLCPRDYGAITPTFDNSGGDKVVSVSVIFRSLDEIRAEYGHDAYTVYNGPAYCTIIAPDFYGWASVYSAWLLGHEMMHCLFGSWHEEDLN